MILPLLLATVGAICHVLGIVWLACIWYVIAALLFVAEIWARCQTSELPSYRYTPRTANQGPVNDDFVPRAVRYQQAMKTKEESNAE